MKICWLSMVACALALTGNSANAIHTDADVDEQDEFQRHLTPGRNEFQYNVWLNSRAAKHPNKNWRIGLQAQQPQCEANARFYNNEAFDICLFFDNLPGPNGKNYDRSWMDPFGVAAEDWEAVLKDFATFGNPIEGRYGGAGTEPNYWWGEALAQNATYYDLPTLLDDFFLIVEGSDTATMSEDEDYSCPFVAITVPLLARDGVSNGLGVPIAAKITVNTDYDAFLSQDFWYGLARHEVGHALGFSSNILSKQLGWENETVPVDSNVKTAWDAICGDDGGSPPYISDAGAHWIAGCVQNEVMGQYTSDDFRPISKLTLAAFKDLGYNVTEENADDFSLSESLSKCGDFCPRYSNGEGWFDGRTKQENIPPPFEQCSVIYPPKGSNSDYAGPGTNNAGDRRARKLLTSKGHRIPDNVIATAEMELSKQKSVNNNGKRSANSWVSISYWGEGGHLQSETFTHDDFEDIPMKDESGEKEGERTHFLRATGP